MLFRSLVVVGLVGFVTLTANVAVADDAKSASQYRAVEGISFADPAAQSQLTPARDAPPTLNLATSQGSGHRFAQFSASPQHEDSALQNYEVALVAQRGAYGLPVDVSFAQRASIGVNSAGDIAHRGRGSEVRFGRGLLRGHHRGPRSSWDQPTIYAFAASDDEALTWAPGSSSAGRSAGFALQDRIEIGDMQAGFTYEAGPFQASLAYVERKISARTGATTVYQSENFAGVTLTLRH